MQKSEAISYGRRLATKNPEFSVILYKQLMSNSSKETIKVVKQINNNKMYKIDFNYRYGKDYVFCSDYKVDNYFVYPLNKEGKPMCTISRTNIISITKDNKTT